MSNAGFFSPTAPDYADDPPVSGAMRRVLEALFLGEPVPLDAQAELTAFEQAEVAALARTANLTYLTLSQPDPSADAEARSLSAAQKELARRPLVAPPPPVAEPETIRPALLRFWERLRGKRD